ncbi:unnamed protein product [Schistocephalus solidus]|uniref:PRELI/MSF1 domain-containing protein n=1 Tax=Schistocephalus solidus TaxID=70667 RepID=A0A183TRD8_SCHSO|nr:unnamed protein product [Schistocephalus solidus]
METTHKNSSRVLLDWFLVRKTTLPPQDPLFRRALFQNPPYRPQTMELIESQPWNNITVFKQIVGERNDNLLLEAVLIMHRAGPQNTATYECQAGEILSGRRARVYDTLSFNFTDETRHVLSDSPTERHAMPTGRQQTVLRLSDAFSRLKTDPFTSTGHYLSRLESTVGLILVQSASNYFMRN